MRKRYVHPVEKASDAFAGRKVIRVKKISGQFLEPGYITSLYGEIAFRIKPLQAKHDSQFIRMADIADIVFVDQLA